MYFNMKKAIFAGLALVSLLAFTSPTQLAIVPVELPGNQQIFWQELQKLCGNTYPGTLVTALANDTTFTNKALLLQIKACSDGQIRIPLVVGNDHSRTWILTKNAYELVLRHEHRYRHGSADPVSLYGGHTTNDGTEMIQFFPADRETPRVIPAGSGNIWWIELLPDKSLTYNLRRMAGEREVTLRFDLTKPVATPDAPWGWKD
ncbi:hypothetical protein BH09BAC4_BH09BAC4_18630 [soil metagenome]